MTDQRGMTLVETMIALVVLSVLSASGIVGLLALLNMSASADVQSKTDALLSGASEALKQMDYRPCATPAGYQQAFVQYEAQVDPSARLRQDSGASVTVTAVDAGPRCDTGVDAGVQIIELTATARGRSRTASLVKRDPNAAPDGPVAVIDAPTVMSSGTDLLYTVSLTARASTATFGIMKLDWDCGPDALTDADHPRTYTTYTVADPTVLCTFLAPAVGRPAVDRTISLTVTDVKLATDSTTRVIAVPPSSTFRALPTASFTYVQTSTAPQGNDYNPGTVVFNASTSSSSDGSGLTFRWTFGDAAAGVSNQATVVNPTHVYYSPGTFSVTLTVTDDFGLSSSQTQIVTVKDSGKKLPTVVFSASPSTGVAPQLVSFDSTGTKANAAGASLTPSSYVWSFGDGGNASGANPTHRYTAAGTYTVTLAVTDSLGNTASTASTVTYTTLQVPPVFIMYDARGEFFHGGDFYFSWTNAAGSPGDSIYYEIEVRATAGCLAFGTQTRTVAASGSAGSPQSYDWYTPMPATNVCLGSNYQYRVRTKRVSPTEGTTFSDWTARSTFHISHT